MTPARETLIRECWRARRRDIIAGFSCQPTSYVALHYQERYLVFTLRLDEQHNVVVAYLECEGVTLCMGPLIHR